MYTNMIRKCDENNSTVVKKYATTKKTLEIQTFKADRRPAKKYRSRSASSSLGGLRISSILWCPHEADLSTGGRHNSSP